MVSDHAIGHEVVRVMRSPRAASATLLLAGMAIGSAADRIPARTATRAGDYLVLSGDFHVTPRLATVRFRR
jgi:hypothetical protein